MHSPGLLGWLLSARLVPRLFHCGAALKNTSLHGTGDA